MILLGWFFWVAALALNAHAIYALLATRRADATALKRAARRCLASALAICGLIVVGELVAVAIIMQPPDGATPASERARYLANTISEAINAITFAVIATIVPLIATFVLNRRARRFSP